jgi:hypothetical protein
MTTQELINKIFYIEIGFICVKVHVLKIEENNIILKILNSSDKKNIILTKEEFQKVTHIKIEN